MVASVAKLGVDNKTRAHAQTGKGRRGNDLSLKSGIERQQTLLSWAVHPSAERASDAVDRLLLP